MGIFLLQMVHCGTWDKRMMPFVQQVYDIMSSVGIHDFKIRFIDEIQINWKFRSISIYNSTKRLLWNVTYLCVLRNERIMIR